MSYKLVIPLQLALWSEVANNILERSNGQGSCFKTTTVYKCPGKTEIDGRSYTSHALKRTSLRKHSTKHLGVKMKSPGSGPQIVGWLRVKNRVTPNGLP